ncbi:MAG: toll/interleukin-1 receptor domain-containing protein [Agriterribacter sp.]
MDGLVFVSYSRDDKSRVERLVNYLAENNIPLWWDADLQGGDNFSNVISDKIEKAACVIVVWSKTSVVKDWVRSEADEARKRHIFMPVLLDADIKIPKPFDIYHHYNFTDENFISGKEIEKMLRALVKIIKYGKPVNVYVEELSSGWSINRAISATDEVRELVNTLRSITEIMTLDTQAIRDIKFALKEVEKTYDVVSKTITTFLKPVFEKKISYKPFLEMERGSLEKIIKQGHGHCSVILTYYKKYGGVRDAIKQHINEVKLKELDEVFEKLGTADGDLFYNMTSIGYTLTSESRIILNLLLGNQQNVAKERLIEDRNILQPLEDNMRHAFTELQDLSQSIGTTL